MTKGSELLVAALENEGVEQVFGIPGEENLDVVEALRSSSIELVLTRHEQAAAFMAATHGRLTGRPGVCISTLGPGALNFSTGAAYAHLGAMPMIMITGQKPIVTRAKRSIAQFRLRTGMPIGAKVTLRGQRMYDFLERTMSLALPRIRDFRGIPTRSFDGRGNFSLGLHEQLVYPEIDYDKIDRLRGLEISIVTTAKTDEEGRKLLELLGMPFQSN